MVVVSCTTLEDPEKIYLYHLVPKALWLEHKELKKEYFPSEYNKDKFIHLSDHIEKLIKIANKYYTKDKSEFLVLEIDPSKVVLPRKILYEAGVPVGKLGKQQEQKKISQTLWPHLYGGGLEKSFVSQEYDVKRDANGKFLSVSK